MNITNYGILIISSEKIHQLDIIHILLDAGFSDFYEAADFIEAIWIIEKAKPKIMIIDLHYYGTSCINGKLHERVFAAYVWNRFAIPHIYISPAGKNVWEELRLFESKPIAIIESRHRYANLIDVVKNECYGFEDRIKQANELKLTLKREEEDMVKSLVLCSNKLGTLGESTETITHKTEKYIDGILQDVTLSYDTNITIYSVKHE